eukprot:Hpha_TRINITY_DN5534_c0_g1::TRINITY_DN5534_c0_g1_i1::g.93680::m.93680
MSEDAAEFAWERFRQAAAGDFSEEDFQVMSLDTFKSLLPAYGIVDPIERARVEVRWRAYQRQPLDPVQFQVRDVAPLRSPPSGLTPDELAAAEAAAAAAAAAVGARTPVKPSESNGMEAGGGTDPHVSPVRYTPIRTGLFAPPSPSPEAVMPYASPSPVDPTLARPTTGLLSPARPPSPPPHPADTHKKGEPEARPQPPRRSMTPGTASRFSRSPSATHSTWSYPAIHPQPFEVPKPQKASPSLSRRRRLCPEGDGVSDPNSTAHYARNQSPPVGIRHCSDKQAQASVGTNLNVMEGCSGSPTRRKRVTQEGLRRASVVEITGDVKASRRAITTIPAPVPSNPNPDKAGPEQRRTRANTRIHPAAQGDPNAIPGQQHPFAREVPPPTDESMQRRSKAAFCLQDKVAIMTGVGVRVEIPKLGASKHRSQTAVAPAHCDPNAQHEGKEAQHSCRGHAANVGDFGVMPPWGPRQAPQRVLGPPGAQEQGVIPGSYSWNAREGSKSPCSRRAPVNAPVAQPRSVEGMQWPAEAEAPKSPQRKGRVGTGVRQQIGACGEAMQWNEEPRTRSPSRRARAPGVQPEPQRSPSRRRKQQQPAESGVMPGASGWPLG